MGTDVCSLMRELPVPLAAELDKMGIKRDAVLMTTDSDLDFIGSYAEHWFVLTAEQIMSFALDAEGAHQVVSVPVADATAAQMDARVGSGFLLIQTDRGWVKIIRFSNAKSNTFVKVATKLRMMIEGTPVTVTAEDDIDLNSCPKCGRHVTEPGSLCLKCISKSHVFGRFFKLMIPLWPYTLAAMIILVMGICLSLVPPRLTQTLVDNVFGKEPMPKWFAWATGLFGAETKVSWLLMLVLGLAATQVVSIVVHVLNGLLSTTISNRIMYDMRLRLFTHLQSLSIRYFDQNPVGRLMTSVSQDVEQLSGFVWQITNGFVYNFLQIVGVLVFMFVMNAHLAMFVLIPIPFVMCSTYLYWRYVQPRYYRYYDRRSKMANLLYSALSGIRVVKAFAQEPRETNRIQKGCDRVRAAGIAVDVASSTYYPIVSFVLSCGGLIVWYIGGRAILEEHSITLGTLMAFFGYLGMFYGPLQTLMGFGQWLTMFTTQANRIFEVLDTGQEIRQAAKPVEMDIKGEIKFERVVFGYDAHTPVLKRVNLTIKAGEMLGVVGHSGSGKTTLVNLLMRYYDPTAGKISIDGVNVKDIKLSSLRQQIGLVLQDAQLFSGTIRENIAYGRPDASVEEVFDAANAARAHDFIVRMPDGYDTRLGEGGAGLSGGERQRISIARALLFNPRILVLDEATSSVDTVTEREIQRALEALTRGRTTIAIAHRLSTLRNADRIVVFEEGRIVEMGTHEELVELKGLYHEMVSIQTQLTKEKE